MNNFKQKSNSKYVWGLFQKIVTFILEAIVLLIIIGLVIGLFKASLDLAHNLGNPVQITLRLLTIDLITLLALVEILKTVFSYLTEGRVRVTYIIDTVIIIMLNELISGWFAKLAIMEIAELLSIISILIFLRVIVISISPKQ